MSNINIDGGVYNIYIILIIIYRQKKNGYM